MHNGGKNRSILITATQSRAEKFADDLKKIGGLYIHCSPALVVSRVHTPIPTNAQDCDAVLMTSGFALDHIYKDIPNHLPMIVVGDETATMARDYGFDVIDVGTNGIESIDFSAYQSVLYPCAKHPTFIPGNAIPWMVYETCPNDAFDISDDIDVVCVFSKRGAGVVAPYIRSHHIVICLSKDIADVIRDNAVSCQVAHCTYPRYDMMIEKIKEYT